MHVEFANTLSDVSADAIVRKTVEAREAARVRTMTLIATGAALPMILDSLVRSIEAEQPEMLCSVLLLDSTRTHLLMGAAPSLPDFYNKAIHGLPIGPEGACCGTAAFYGKRVVVEDIETDPMCSPFLDLARRAGLRACWSEPILNASGQVIGTFAIYHRYRKVPSNAETILIASAAQLAAVAIERKQTEEALRESEAFLKSIYDGIELAVFIVDVMENGEFRIAGSNAAHERLTGAPTEELMGKTLAEIETPEADEIRRRYAECVQGNAPTTYEECLTFHGKKTWWMTTLSPIRDASARIYRLVGTSTNITERKRDQERILYNALHDPLTDLPNRTLFLERLDLAIRQTQDAANPGYAVLFLDLDRFKVINDSMGHLAGDQLLKNIAQRLQLHLREQDLVARLGGDEFVILLENAADEAYAVQVAERILTDFQPAFLVHETEIVISASIGIVLGTKAYSHSADLLRDVDIAMYRAKAQGGNSYKVFDSEMHTQAVNRLTLETDFRKALERSAFVVYYQPIIDISDGRLTGFEALARMQHPTRGLISPTDFISVAEETGLIVPLDRWMLVTACWQLADWKSRFANHGSLKMSINLSAQDLRKTRFLDEVDQALAQTGLDGESLVLELTESILIENIEQTIELLSQLKARKVQIGIDDFGTGYSSLSYLHSLPVDYLKIDRSFVSQMEQGNRNYQVVNTIITLSNHLGLSAVAEGVETAQQLEWVKQLGCEFAQGYLFAAPMSAQEIETLFFQAVGR